MKKEEGLPAKVKANAWAGKPRSAAAASGGALEIHINTLRTLLAAPLYPVKFSAAFRVILELGVMSDGWRAAFENAHEKRASRRTKRRERSYAEEERALKQLERMLGRIAPFVADSEIRAAQTTLPVFRPAYDPRSALDRLVSSLDAEWLHRAQPKGGSIQDEENSET